MAVEEGFKQLNGEIIPYYSQMMVAPNRTKNEFEKCLTAFFSFGDLILHDFECDRKKGFVCHNDIKQVYKPYFN